MQILGPLDQLKCLLLGEIVTVITFYQSQFSFIILLMCDEKSRCNISSCDIFIKILFNS